MVGQQQGWQRQGWQAASGVARRRLGNGNSALLARQGKAHGSGSGGAHQQPQLVRPLSRPLLPLPLPLLLLLLLLSPGHAQQQPLADLPASAQQQRQLAALHRRHSVALRHPSQPARGSAALWR